jgi:hypothetical protein
MKCRIIQQPLVPFVIRKWGNTAAGSKAGLACVRKYAEPVENLFRAALSNVFIYWGASE